MLKEEGEAIEATFWVHLFFPRLTLLTEECQERSRWTLVRSLKTTGASFQAEMKEYHCPFSLQYLYI